MLTSGEIVDIMLGSPQGNEAGFRHPAVVVTADTILDSSPTVVHVVPLTSTIRGYSTEVTLEPDSVNELTDRSAAQCQHIRSVSTTRVLVKRGHVGPMALAQIRELLALTLDIPK